MKEGGGGGGGGEAFSGTYCADICLGPFLRSCQRESKSWPSLPPIAR